MVQLSPETQLSPEAQLCPDTQFRHFRESRRPASGATGAGLIAVILAALTAVAVGGPLAAATGGAAAGEPAIEADGRLNVVLITLDTVRADHLGAYGYPAARTPVLDRLAARGVRFARVDAAAPITLPSHASILTGLLPPRHGVRDNGAFRLAGEHRTVTEALAERGYDTAAVIAAVVLARRYGLDQGFAAWDESFAEPAESAPEAAEERDAAAVTDAALAQLAALRAPFFLWVHYFDPHADYRPPARLLGAQEGDHRSYDAEIAHVDEQLGRLLAALPERTAVVVVGDHGEMLGERGEATHGVLLHRGARRVPLLIAGPGVPVGAVVEPLVRTVDVAPTLLELAAGGAESAEELDEELAEELDGVSLAPLWRLGKGTDRTDRLAYSESFLPFYAYRWHPLRALSDGRWLFVDGAEPRLFDLAADPAEERNLAAERTVEVDSWRRRLVGLEERWGEAAAPPEPAPLSAEERSRLAALGYLGGGGSTGDAADLAVLPDPYDLVDVVDELLELSDRVAAGGCDEALAPLRAILRRNRDNLPALQLAGGCLVEAGEGAAAVPYFEHAVETFPGSAAARAGLGGALLLAGRTAEAEAAYRRALEADPGQPEAVANLARLLRERGAAGEAAAVLAAAFATGGDHSGWWRERGLLAAARGDLEAARADFLAAAEADPADRAALENAARAAYRLGRPAEAAALYRRLAELDPARPGPWKTLGAIQLHQLGDRAAARESFRRALEVETDPADRRELEELLGELE